jgi:hypothetical protein
LLPCPSGFAVKYLWSGAASTTKQAICATVAPHGVVLYRVQRR